MLLSHLFLVSPKIGGHISTDKRVLTVNMLFLEKKVYEPMKSDIPRNCIFQKGNFGRTYTDSHEHVLSTFNNVRN